MKQKLQEVIMARQLKPSGGPEPASVVNPQWATGSAEFPLRKTGRSRRISPLRPYRGYDHTPVIRVK